MGVTANPRMDRELGMFYWILTTGNHALLLINHLPFAINDIVQGGEGVASCRDEYSEWVQGLVGLVGIRCGVGAGGLECGREQRGGAGGESAGHRHGGRSTV